MTGKVKWFDDAKGYGFIVCDNREGDIFVHYSQIMGEGFKTLAENQRVEFDLYEDAGKGMSARNVIKGSVEMRA